ncbi:MAG: DUF4394 domain-containing protein [Rubrimonas sp.]
MRMTLSLALAGALGAAGAEAAPIALTLGNNGSTLVRMNDLSNPAIKSGVPITDVEGRPIAMSDIDWRPSDGRVYGYSNMTRTIYTIDTATGVATAVTAMPGATNVDTVGLDFNNRIDAARIVSTNEDNLVFFPENFEPARPDQPEIARFTNLFYLDGDVNAGQNPEVFANAYLNATIEARGNADALGAVQYALDAATDSLVMLNNNAGDLTTVGLVTFGGERLDFTANGGFDVYSTFADGMFADMAYALLTTADGIALYSLVLDPVMGQIAAERLGFVGSEFGALRGLTVFDPGMVAPIPLPAAGWMLMAGLAGLGAMARRRRG